MHEETEEVLDRRAEALIEDHDKMLRALVSYRHKHNLTQEKVAERMGISQPAVSQFERYDANPRLDTVRRYAMAVGVVFQTAVEDDTPDYVESGPQQPITRISAETPSRQVAWGSPRKELVLS